MSTPGSVEKYLIKRTKRSPVVAALIDPEDFSPSKGADIAVKAIDAGASVILVGGSTLSNQRRLDTVVRSIKHHVTSRASRASLLAPRSEERRVGKECRL